MENTPTESKKSDEFNLFEKLLGKNNFKFKINIDKIKLQKPNDLIIDCLIFIKNKEVWRGNINITEKELALKNISEKLKSKLVIFDNDNDSEMLYFDKNKVIVDIKYSQIIKRRKGKLYI